MNDMKLPAGIRKTPTLQDGSFSYEARVNRQGVQMSKRWPTVKKAFDWKARTDYLIEQGIDPRQDEDYRPRTRTVKTDSSDIVPTLSTKSEELQDVPTTPQLDMTVAQAIDGYLAQRADSHLPLKSNQITEYERVRDDWGNLKIANLKNKEVAEYITRLLKSPRIRDDPKRKAMQEEKRKAKRAENSGAATKPPPSAKALANAKYKARLKAAMPPRKPEPLAEATVRKYILALKTAIEWQAKNNGVMYDRFLFDFDNKVMPAAWNGRRDRRLLAGEEERLYAAGIDRGGYTYTKEDWQMLIGFALETALRQQELALAKWEDQRNDWSKMFIPKKNSKTKKDRYILLTPRAREIIKFQQSTCPKGVKRIFHQFPNAQAMCDAYMKLTKRAGIEDLTFHDLRHEATSRLCEASTRSRKNGGNSMSLMEIMEMTGHDTMTTFRGYVKLIAHENSRRLK